MGDRKTPASRLEADATLGGMLKHGVRVKQLCKACGRSTPVDVAAWCTRLGPRTSLWDYFMPCKFDDCPDGLTAVQVSASPASPFRPLESYDVFRTLDKMGWEFVPRWPGQRPYSYGIEE